MSEWISVNDRMPEQKLVVLGYCQKTKKAFVGYCWDGEKYWKHIGASGAEYSVRSKVTHWMPIPELPED